MLLGIADAGARVIAACGQLLDGTYATAATAIEPLPRSRDALRPARRRTDAVEQPLLRHLRGLLEISRAAASGRGPMPVLESMADLIQGELQLPDRCREPARGP